MRSIAFIVIFFVSTLTACTSEDASTTTLVASENGVPRSAADVAWDRLSKPSSAAYPAPPGGRLAYFMKGVELDRQRLRREGLAFWHAYPDDPRRYTWLIMTTYMAPFYPKYLDEWAMAEEILGPNTSDADAIARQSWSAKYTELRSEFDRSPAVTPVQRRQLKSAEIHHLHHLALYHRERGEPSMSDDQLFTEIVQFLEEFPMPPGADAMQAVAYAWDRDRVVAPLLGWAAFAKEPAHLASRLADSLEAKNIPWSDEYAGFENGKYRSRLLRFQLIGHAKLQTHFEEQNHDSWTTWHASNAADGSILPAIYASSQTFPSVNRATGGVEAQAIAAFDISISLVKMRELGLIYFDRMPLDDQVHWAHETSWRIPMGYRSAVHGWRHLVENPRKVDSSMFDVEGLLASDQAVRTRIDQLLSNPALNGEQVDLMRDRMLLLGIYSMTQAWRAYEDRSYVEAKLAEIKDASANGYDALAEKYASRLVRPNDESSAHFGLSEMELAAFLEQFLDEGGPSMQRLARSYLNRVTLEPGVSVSIQAPTLDGDNVVSTQDYRGKIVLVDNWDTNCAPCIAAFPKLQEIYEEYQDRGLEIMSIAYDGESQRSSVDRIKRRLGLTWETLNGEGLWGAMTSRYGVSGFPQYMLLDRQGRFVAGNAEINGRMHELPHLLDDLLSKDGTAYYSQAPAMWEIADDDTVIHLFGTIHSVKPGFEWWTKKLEQAADSADVVYFEIPKRTRPTPERFAELEARYFRNPADVRLSDSLTAEQTETVRHAFETAGLDWGQVETYTIDYAVAQLGRARREAAGVRESVSADKQVSQAFRGGRDEEERAFASYEQQMAYFSDISPEGQIAYLMAAVEDGGGSEFDRLFAAWRVGDLETMTEIGVSTPQAEMPEAYQVLVVNRNRAWAEELARAMEEESGSVFVAVGAGHLVGPDSLQNMLAEQGYDAQRVQ